MKLKKIMFGLLILVFLSNFVSAQTLNLDSLIGSPIVSPRYPEAGDDFNLLCGYYDENLETIDSITFKIIGDGEIRQEVQINDTQRNVYYSPNGSYTVRDDELLDLSCTYQDGPKSLTVNKTVQVDTVVDDPRWFFTNVDTAFPTLSYYTNKFLDTTYSAIFDVDHDGFSDIDEYDLNQDDIVGIKLNYDISKKDLPYNLYLAAMPRGNTEVESDQPLLRNDDKWQCPEDRGWFRTKSDCARIYEFKKEFDYYRIRLEDKEVLDSIALNLSNEYDIYVLSNSYVKNDSKTVYVQPGGKMKYLGTFQPHEDNLILPVQASEFIAETHWQFFLILGIIVGLGILLAKSNFTLFMILEILSFIILFVKLWLM